MMVVGSYNAFNGCYRMHAPDGGIARYMGYTLSGMKRAYRKDFGLERKHIEWVII